MRVAVTYENGKVFQHFGHTEQFKIYDVQEGKIIGSNVVDTNGSGHGALSEMLSALGVDILICGGIGGGAQIALAQAGIKLDSDVVLTDDIAKLFDIDIGENYIGACNDLSIADIPPLVAYTEKAVGVNAKEYINSGVLLMNLKKMRDDDLEGHFLALLNKYHFDSIAPDQDYLNAMCNGKIYYLEEKWDTMPNDAKPMLTETSLIHYNLFSKPWCYDGIQYEEQFWNYAQDCGFIDEIREFKASYTEDKKKADSECLELLVRRGIEIPENDITFKKMNEKGVRIRL